MHHVIVGAGPAGVVAAETLRKADARARITLLGDEPEPPYSRMAIPYLLEGQIEEPGTYLRHTPTHFDDLAIDVVQARAARLDPHARRLSTVEGRQIGFDKLLIATGASPIRPPIEGLDHDGVHSCWTLADAREIMHLAEPGTPVVLVGAGFIGCIILESLLLRGVDLTVVEQADRMVARMLDPVAGGMLQSWCEMNGVRVLTGQSVRAIAGGQDGGSALSVRLDSGQSLQAALVVIAAGVRSNTQFLDGSGLKIDGGVCVDDFMCSSHPDVFAAGDAAQAKDLTSGQFSVLAIQPVAVDHGRIAALNMAGQPTPHQGSLNMNVLDTMGLISSSFGSWQGVPGGSRTAQADDGAYRYIRLEFEGDRLVGAQAVGLTEHVGMLRGLIQTGLRLGAWKDKLMKSPERLAEAYVATAQGIAPV